MLVVGRSFRSFCICVVGSFAQGLCDMIRETTDITYWLPYLSIKEIGCSSFYPDVMGHHVQIDVVVFQQHFGISLVRRQRSDIYLGHFCNWRARGCFSRNILFIEMAVCVRSHTFCVYNPVHQRVLFFLLEDRACQLDVICSTTQGHEMQYIASMDSRLIAPRHDVSFGPVRMPVGILSVECSFFARTGL